MTEFKQDMRHYCRNPRCRSKLPEPVSNPREAFCAPGCHSAFYRRHCLVCEAPMERRTEHQLVCGKRACRNALRAGLGFGRYHVSSRVISPSKNADSIGVESRLKLERASPTPAAEHSTGTWSELRVIAAGEPITANAYHAAVIGAGAALAEADRVNGAHWRAAKAGKAGYGPPDVVPATSSAVPMPSKPAVPQGRPAGLPAIPDDLSIPAFLRRSLCNEPARLAA
jgi:hypothetical protein